MMSSENLAFTSAFELKNMILDKKISALEMTDFFYKRIDDKNPTLNAFLFLDKEDARNYAKLVDGMVAKGQTDKPLLGIPSVVPDVLHMKNTPTTFGSVVFKDAIHDEDEIEIGILKDAGTVILGKTNLSEFGLSYDTENALTGPCVNPWNHAYSAGGGAAGAAAAVVAGLSPFALATDFNGALRMSCSFCGAAGIMPSRGRIPTVRKHLLPYTEMMFYRKGIIARNIIDIAMMLNVLSKPDPRDPICCKDMQQDYVKCVQSETPKQLKIALCPDLGFMPVDPEVSKAVAKGARNLEKLGHAVEEININLSSDVLTHFQNLFTADRYILIMKYMHEHPDSFRLLTDRVKRWLKVGNDVTGPQYSMAITYLGMLEEKIDNFLKDYDFILTPTVPTTPYLQGEAPSMIEGEQIKPYIGLCGFLAPFNMSGHPSLTLPCDTSSQDLPIGMQLVGRKFSESLLLTLAHQYEKKHPFPQLND